MTKETAQNIYHALKVSGADIGNAAIGIIEKELEELAAECERLKGTMYSIAIDDPYPVDIFPPLTPQEWKSIHNLIQDKLGIPIDRMSADYGRLLRKPLIEEAKECISKLYPNEAM